MSQVCRISFERFLDTSMLDVDIQPTYLRVTLRKPEKKDKVIQLHFPAEASPHPASRLSSSGR